MNDTPDTDEVIAGHPWRMVTGKLVMRPITGHPQYRLERNKRKRARWKKRLKRMGITEFHDPQFWWEDTGESAEHPITTAIGRQRH